MKRKLRMCGLLLAFVFASIPLISAAPPQAPSGVTVDMGEKTKTANVVTVNAKAIHEQTVEKPTGKSTYALSTCRSRFTPKTYVGLDRKRPELHPPADI